MKNTFLKLTAAVLFLAALMTNCKKTDAYLTEDFSNEQIELLVAKTDHFINYAEITFENGILFMQNEGISPDFTVIATDFDKDSDNPSSFTSKNEGSFLDCLRKLELKDDQRIRIRKALGRYEDCKASAIKRTRAAYQQLLLEYQKQADRIEQLYRLGYITEKQYQNKIALLRLEFRKGARKLQLKEDKALKDCYKQFLRELKSILSEKQWQLFYECQR